MKKNKFTRGLSDADMMANSQEKITFETQVEEEKVTPAKKLSSQRGTSSDFVTPELQESIGKALLALKVNLYKKGIVDYKIKVEHADDKVILVPVPDKKKNS